MTTINKDDINVDYEILNIKVENKQRIISNYSYDGTDKLNKELRDFIVDKTKNANTNKPYGCLFGKHLVGCF